MARKEEITKQEEDEASSAATAAAAAGINRDVLETIFSHVSLVDLLPACHVSKSWNSAVYSSLHHFNKIKPWLMVHTQRTRSPHVTTTHAYDPRSGVWIEIKQPPIKFVSTLRSSHSTLLYMLSPSGFSFSFDPLHLKWHDVDAPLVWRTDPIVAMVNDYVVLAGGTCEFEEDPLAVEMYDLRTRAWERCQSMPVEFKDSANPTWQSAAVDSGKFYVTEKHSGTTYSFDPENKTWQGPFDFRPDPNVSCSAITCANNRLILVGLLSCGSVKLWEVANDMSFKEIGEMPEFFWDKLKGSGIGEDDDLSAIAVTSMDDFVYIYNDSNPEEVVLCEINNCEGECKWSSIKNVVVNDETRIMDRFVFTCSRIGMADLQRASLFENRRFAVKEME